MDEKHTTHSGNSAAHNHHKHHKKMLEDFQSRFILSLFLTFPILVLSPLIQKLFGFELRFIGSEYVLLALSTILFFYGGWPFLSGFVKEVKKKQPGMMTLIALAISVAFFYSVAVVFGLEGKFFFWELATLIVIMLLGHLIEMRSILGASRALENLAKLVPAEAHAIQADGAIRDIPLSKLMRGNFVLVRPGEKIPADGVVEAGQTMVNEAMLTGESKPQNKQKGSKVIAGSINGEGSMRVRVTGVGKDSYISQIIALVEKAQKSKSKTQGLADKAAVWLTIISVSIGTITFFLWFYFGNNLAFAMERMATVMIITCPHALGLAIPLVAAVSTSISAKKGILIRNRIAFEKAKDLQTIVFDKTGTLTRGEFGITDIITEWRYEEKDVLFYAASLEKHSEHPIAKAILAKAKKLKVKTVNPENFISLPGKGIRGIVEGKQIKVVGQNYLKRENVEIESKEINNLLEQGKTVVYVLLGNKIIGAIALADLIREESKQAITKLKAMGIKCTMLTGDDKRVAKWVAEELKIDKFFAQVLPHEKSEVIKKIQSEGQKVAMVGDGVNDAPALTQADVGIAIGAGTDVAIESADIILVRNDPRDIISIINLAKSTYDTMQENLAWATGYNIIAIPLAAGVLYKFGIFLSPAMGAILMSLSTVIVAINARLLPMKR